MDISKGPVTPENDPLGPSIKHGTCGYWPPEVIKEQPYTVEPDYWALGCTAFQMFCDRLPFYGNNDDEKNEMILASEEWLPKRFTHGEPPDLQAFVCDCLTIDVKQRLGCRGRGLAELKEHIYFEGFDWAALEAGALEAPIKPNVNDINAPSKNEIAPFVKPKDVTWEASDEALFTNWDYACDSERHGFEAIYRIRKRKELVEALAADGLKPVLTVSGGGGGGCCGLM